RLDTRTLNERTLAALPPASLAPAAVTPAAVTPPAPQPAALQPGASRETVPSVTFAPPRAPIGVGPVEEYAGAPDTSRWQPTADDLKPRTVAAQVPSLPGLADPVVP